MGNLERLMARTGETNQTLLNDLLESAKTAILNRRFPFDSSAQELESKYLDVQFRLALDLYNRIGGEGELTHNENGIGRTYGSEWMSQQILTEVVPKVGVPS